MSLRKALSVPQVLCVALTATVMAAMFAAPAHAADPAYKVLVFSKTAGFRHDSIAAGTTAIQQLGSANNFTVTATEDAAAFSPANLAQFQAVVFLNTTGDVLDPTQQTAFENYINGGGGYVGVHAAADTEYSWPFYGNLVGAWFASHPAIQSATEVIEDRAHAATQHLSPTWVRTDEWYNYQTNVRSTAHVLASLNESSYTGGGMGADHPHTWCKTVGSGRSFYTGNGHTQESYADPAFRSMLLGGIRYAANRTKADCRPEVGYTDLYGNGGSLTGWSQAGPGSFTNSGGTLTSVDGMGLLWYSAKEFASYSLKLDWRMPGDDNSGVFIGFPSSTDPWSAVNNGYEVQIDPTDAADRTTGSVYTFKSADLAARDAALNPPGEWNTYELLVEGERLQVFLNGVRINDFTNTDPVRSLAQGYIGIQNHGTGDDVSFRHIRIKELGGPVPPGDVTTQAESYSSVSGAQPFTKAGAHNGQTLGYIDPGDWSAYNGQTLTGVTQFRARVVSGGPGGAIQVRTGSTTGPVLGTVAVPNTGNWDTYADLQTTLTGVPTGTANLYLTYTGTGTGLFDVDDFTLVKGAPAAVQAESFTSQAGVQIVADAGAQGGSRVGYIDNGDWIGFAGVSAAGATAVTVRAASGGSGGTVQLRTGSATGPLLGSVAVPNTGGYANFANFTTNLTAGSGPVFLLFTGTGGGLLDVDSFTLTTGGTPGVGPVRGLAGKCLDVNGAGTADGTKIQLYTCSGSAAQSWTRSGQTLRALGKCLDVSGAGTADGTLVQLWTCNASGAQNWTPNADGTLRNPNSGKCLDVTGSSSADGTQIRIWTCLAGAANQQWILP